MSMLKVKVVDAAGTALAGQTVKVSGAEALQTSAGGLTQFLIDSDVPLTIEINDVPAWSGNASQLAREELFKATGTGFARVSAG